MIFFCLKNEACDSKQYSKVNHSFIPLYSVSYFCTKQGCYYLSENGSIREKPPNMLVSSLPANQARQENEEKNINKTHMAKSKIQNKVKKIIADRVRLPIDTYKRPGAPDYPPRFSSDKFKNLVQYSICVFFRSNTILYWFLESLSVPTYRATGRYSGGKVRHRHGMARECHGVGVAPGVPRTCQNTLEKCKFKCLRCLERV